jgi:hypothetical protein
MWTKEQKAAYDKKYAKENKEKLQQYQKEWREKNKEYLAQYAKDNAEKISKQQKESRQKHPERVKQNWDDWYAKNKMKSPKRRFSEAKHAAKKRDIEWLLALEEYSTLIIMPCYYCANKLGEPVKRAIGLDRLDSEKGYELSNVVSCCYTCNCIKHQFLTPEEMLLIAKTLIEFREMKQRLSIGETLT